MMRLYTTLLCVFLALGLQAQTARVQVIHNSPTPGADAGPVVDIYVNDALLPELTGVPFRAATPYLDVAAGVDITVAVAVNPSTSSADAIASFNLGQLTDGGTFTLIANGIVGDVNNPFNIEVNGTSREAAMMAGNVEFIVFHGSPDAPAVDVDAKGVGNLIENLAFGSFTADYASVPPARYLLDVRANGSTDVVATFDADLSGLANGAATVFASGFLGTTPAFGLFAALPDGTVVEFPGFTPSLVINEVDYDQDGTDTGEFIELKNTGDASIPLVGTQLVLINGNGGTEYNRIDLPNEELGAGEYFVVCFGDNAEGYCDLNGGASVQNGAPDAITLEFSGNTIDALSYEGSVDGAVEGSGEGLEDLDDVAPGSLSRFPDGTDTDQNNVDFVFQCATPGTSNDGADIACYPTTRLQVIHNSPTPGTDAGPVVDIYVNGGLLPELTGVPFRAATAFLDVPALLDLSIAVAVNPSTSVDDAIATFDVGALSPNDTYVVIANGIVGNADTPFNLEINANAQEAAETGGNVEFAGFHGSPGAPNVDIDARGVGNLIPDLAFGTFTEDYLSVAPDVYYLDVRAANDPNIVATFEADLSGLADGAATVFASGLLGDTPGFGLFAALPDGTVVEFPAVASLQLIHNSPSPTVDVYVNDGLYEDDFAFRTATEFRFVPAGVSLDIAIAGENSASSADAIATFPGVVLETGRSYVVVANGIVGDANDPFNLEINENGRSTGSTTENVDFNVFHGSPDAPNVDVDVRLVGNVIGNLAFTEFSDYLTVAPGVYFVDVRAAGDPNIVATFEADLSGLAGGAATVFASGFLTPGADQPAFGLFAVLADGTVLELPTRSLARLQLIHNSPTPTVDIYVNGDLFQDDFVFQTATEFRFVPAGVELDIAVAGENSTSAADAIATFEDVILENGETYIVVANGIVGNEDTPFDLVVVAGAKERADNADQVELAAFHGSPGAPNVDLFEIFDGPIADDLAFGNASDYTAFTPNVFGIELSVSPDGPLVGTFLFDLLDGAGQGAFIFVSGFVDPADGPQINLLLALPDGTVINALPVAATQVIHNVPVEAASVVDIYGTLANTSTILLFDDLEYRDATSFTYLPTRLPIQIQVAPSNSTGPEDIFANFNNILTLEDGQAYVAIANGLGTAEFPFEISARDGAKQFADDETQLEISVAHGSPGAPAVDISEVAAGELVPGIAYTEFSDYLSLPIENYFIQVRPEDNPALVGTFNLNLNNLNGAEGFATTIVASGIVGDVDFPFDLLIVFPGGQVFSLVPVSGVQIIHNSPAPTVDIYANDIQIEDDLAYLDATPYVFYPSRVPLDFDVAGADSQTSADAIASFDGIVLSEDRSYIVMANGVVGDDNAPFDLTIFDQARQAAFDPGVDLLFFHGSPDAPEVDVTVDGGGVLFDNVSFGNFSDGYQNVPTDNYVVNVTPSDDNDNILASYSAPLADLNAEGASVTIFASGFFESGSTPGFEPCAALADGTVICLAVGTNGVEDQIESFGVQPNPVRTQAEVRYTISEGLDITVNIFDAMGRLISSEYLGQQQAGIYNRSLDVSQLPAGIYNYSLVTSKGTLSRKFVVVK